MSVSVILLLLSLVGIGALWTIADQLAVHLCRQHYQQLREAGLPPGPVVDPNRVGPPRHSRAHLRERRTVISAVGALTMTLTVAIWSGYQLISPLL